MGFVGRLKQAPDGAKSFLGDVKDNSVATAVFNGVERFGQRNREMIKSIGQDVRGMR